MIITLLRVYIVILELMTLTLFLSSYVYQKHKLHIVLVRLLPTVL